MSTALKIAFLLLAFLAVRLIEDACGAQPRKFPPPPGQRVMALLENSARPADADECERARPDLGRPYFTASKRDRAAEPYHHRTCYWRTA